MAYSSRPAARRARDAWDYFTERHPPGRRDVDLCYSPNCDGYGPGWVWTLGSLEGDTFHWKGGSSIVHDAPVANIRSWADSRRASR